MIQLRVEDKHLNKKKVFKTFEFSYSSKPMNSIHSQSESCNESVKCQPSVGAVNDYISKTIMVRNRLLRGNQHTVLGYFKLLVLKLLKSYFVTVHWIANVVV